MSAILSSIHHGVFGLFVLNQPNPIQSNPNQTILAFSICSSPKTFPAWRQIENVLGAWIDSGVCKESWHLLLSPQVFHATADVTLWIGKTSRPLPSPSMLVSETFRALSTWYSPTQGEHSVHLEWAEPRDFEILLKYILYWNRGFYRWEFTFCNPHFINGIPSLFVVFV